IEVLQQALLSRRGQMPCPGVATSVTRRTKWSKPSSSVVDPTEHPTQQCGLPAGSRSIECFLQTIRYEVRYIQVDRVVILPRQRADVTDVQHQVRAEISRDLQCQVLNVRIDIVLIVNSDILGAVRDQ